MKLKRLTALLLCLALAVPVFATEPEAVPETLPPIYVGVQKLDSLPASWDPLEERNADQETILRLTAEPLYRLSGEGGIEPAQAADLPRDVTAEFAGSFGIPRDARRGYAFAISPREGACWEDGTSVTAADWLFTVEKLLEKERFSLEIANYEAVLRGDTYPATEVKSLLEAGYHSVAEAENAGITDFYVDTTWYWGLDAGWLRITDRTRLFDGAIPSGCEEMYVTPAYLYRNYLSETGKEAVFQSEFVGIPVHSGEKQGRDEVGLFVDNNRLILILQEPAAVSTVALAMTNLYPVRNGYGAGAYSACGPYRVADKTATELLLEPNPHWNREDAEFEQIRCVPRG